MNEKTLASKQAKLMTVAIVQRRSLATVRFSVSRSRWDSSAISCLKRSLLEMFIFVLRSFLAYMVLILVYECLKHIQPRALFDTDNIVVHLHGTPVLSPQEKPSLWVE